MTASPKDKAELHIHATRNLSLNRAQISPLSYPNTPTSHIHRVAITGGPCAGKTTALAEIAERLRSRGFGVFVVPEAATLMFTGGASLGDARDEHVINFQTQLLRTQITLEDSFRNLARTSGYKETFILCDRGTCDGRAYLAAKLWDKLLAANQWNMVDIRDGRYDLVVHLVTAADGAIEYYTLDNNKVRSELPEEACLLDRKTQMAWVGHPHLRIVTNQTGFREKINRVDAHISRLAGYHLSRRIIRKFLLSPTSQLPEDNLLDIEHFHVDQTFLSIDSGRHDDGMESEEQQQQQQQQSVRRRGKNGAYTYVHKIRRGIDDSETKRQITQREYSSLLHHEDHSRTTVRISRKCFLHHDTYFVLDCVCNVCPKIRLLRCHSETDDDEIKIPHWLNIEKEVTGDRFYSMYTIATRTVKTNPVANNEGQLYEERDPRYDDVNNVSASSSRNGK